MKMYLVTAPTPCSICLHEAVVRSRNQVASTILILLFRHMYRIRFANTALPVILGLLLLFAQWTGLQHRIAHFGLATPSIHATAILADDDAAAHLHHSCVLFDAAALGITMHSPFYLPPCLRTEANSSREHHESSWDAYFVSHFSSRAPPLTEKSAVS
ncbi:hypothetical protein ACFQUU_12675 [Herbaspirillum sp. GCM10030257]|uniref:hypothetical protein n=1 Tax=Herbaspirillum sp. GCM10030257 TaxID=3273393 RepID=UPI00361373E0